MSVIRLNENRSNQELWLAAQQYARNYHIKGSKKPARFWKSEFGETIIELAASRHYVYCLRDDLPKLAPPVEKGLEEQLSIIIDVLGIIENRISLDLEAFPVSIAASIQVLIDLSKRQVVDFATACQNAMGS